MSPRGRLLVRAMDLLSAKEMPVRITLDDVTFEEFRAMRVLLAEQQAFDARKRREDQS